jgi:hypothetical protein
MNSKERTLAHENAKASISEKLPEALIWGSKIKKNGQITFWMTHKIFASVSFSPSFQKRAEDEKGEVVLWISGLSFTLGATAAEIQMALKELFSTTSEQSS